MIYASLIRTTTAILGDYLLNIFIPGFLKLDEKHYFADIVAAAAAIVLVAGFQLLLKEILLNVNKSNYTTGRSFVLNIFFHFQLDTRHCENNRFMCCVHNNLLEFKWKEYTHAVLRGVPTYKSSHMNRHAGTHITGIRITLAGDIPWACKRHGNALKWS